MTELRAAVPLARASTARALARLDDLPSSRVVALAVLVQWISVAALALTVRHNGWIYYQGGDQLWYYTLGWQLGHGQLGNPLVGYLWPALLAPLALIVGPDIANAYPAIIVVDVVFLLPVATASIFGIARLIGGRRFASFTLLLWLAVPFVGVWFTNPGYHERYTELTLPQSFGLTAMADFPTMVAALVSAYFVARVLYDGRDQVVDAVAAGAAAGAAIGIKPSTALFLAGPTLALLVARRLRGLVYCGVAFLPALATLSLWKWRGFGYLPLIRGSAPSRTAAGPDQITALSVPHYIRFDWAHFVHELDLLREHFWSGRLLEWLVIAGLIGLGLRSRRGLALVGGWFAAFAIVKGGYSHASIEDGSLLRLLIPAIPAFVLMLASLAFLVPRGGRAWRTPQPSGRLPRRVRWATVVVGLGVSAVVPFVAIAAASPVSNEPTAAVIQTPLIPVSVDLGVQAQRTGRAVTISWRPQRPAGGTVFYRVFRAPAAESPFDCPSGSPAPRCVYSGTDVGTTRAVTFSDRPGPGRWEYRIGPAANWLNDPSYGDVYLLSRPSAVDIP